jgi:hypothetical protein
VRQSLAAVGDSAVRLSLTATPPQDHVQPSKKT